MSRPMTPAGGLPGVAATDHTNDIRQDATYLGENNGATDIQRSGSQMSQSATYVPSRGGTLKKKASVHRNSSLKRSGSRKSSYAGSVRSLRVGDKERYEPEEYNSAFYCPIPTAGSPTDLLANRFQSWRKVLKDLITYFRDLHKSYETRSKTLLSASNVLNNTAMPPDFLQSSGIGEATSILRDFHKHALNESHKARDLENEVIMQLTGLRSDLSQKIKEIKSLSGDFKNSVGKEQEATKKAVNAYQEALGLIDHDASATAGRGDPYIQKLAVERQLEKQIEEENYLHRAYLNLEASGRELESIVIGEIQKAYTVLTGILKREGDDNYDVAEKLREGPLAMEKDVEWNAFVTDNHNMVDPRQPLRQADHIVYAERNNPAAIDVRSGMLERKSKYLKNYTPGWYVLSPTHLHEFKSADRIAFQQPVMSLYLPDQKIGSHSDSGSSSHKFMLKGRQTGSMHRGHTWIFRAETNDTMMAWYSDIKELTERTGEARNEFVRRTHARSASGSSLRAPSVSSGASQMEEDEADKVAFSSEQSVRGLPLDDTADAVIIGGVAGAGTAGALAGDDSRSEAGWRPPQQRPQPGGRFPSEVNVNRGLQPPLSPSSEDSGTEQDRDALAAAGALPGSGVPFIAGATTLPHTDLQQPKAKNDVAGPASVPAQPSETTYTAGDHANVIPQATGAEVAHDTQSRYEEWVDTMAAGAGGAALGVAGAAAYKHHDRDSRRTQPENVERQMDSTNAAIPSHGYSSAPMIDSGDGIAVPIVAAAATNNNSNDNSIHRMATTTSSKANNGNLPESIVIPTTVQQSDLTFRSAPVATAAVDDDDVGITPSRPTPHSSKSVQTISDLHIPGEFPTQNSRSDGRSP